MRPRYRRRFLALALAPVLAAGGVAHGSGFLVARYGGQQGHPTTAHPSAIYFNPAGLALGTGTRIDAEGIFAWRSVSYTRPIEAIDNVRAPGDAGAGTPEDAVSANSGEATLGNLASAPFLGVASDLGRPNLGVGLALHAPFGGSAAWDRNAAYAGDQAYPGAEDGVQRWHAIEGSLRSIYLSAAGAYRFPKLGLSVGAGLNLVFSSIAVVRARNANGTDDLVTGAGTLQEGRSLIEASGTTISVDAGVIWQPVEFLSLGLSYQSQPGFGELALSGDLTNQLGATTATVSHIEVLESLPDVWRLGARLRTGRTEVRLSGDYVNWSVFDRQCLVNADEPARNCSLTPTGGIAPDGEGILVNQARNWHDAFGLRLGIAYQLRSDLELNGGWVYDGNAVPDETMDPGLFDMTKLSVGAGARWAVPWRDRQLLIAVDLTQWFYLARTVAARTRDVMNEPVTFDLPTRAPDGAGTYRQSITMFTLGVEYQF